MKRIFISTICIAVIVVSVLSILGRSEINPFCINLSTLNRHTSKGKIINVPTICQYPELPTGCESVAATMLLQHYGEDISAVDFAGEWLEYSEDFHYSDVGLCGPDPNLVFAGNPSTSNSYGCFAGPIVNAINKHSSKCTAGKINAKSVKELCRDYIDKNTPVLIWGTMGMARSHDGDKWNLADGKSFTWTSGEHCLVLVGYDDDYYYFNDPQTGSMVHYKKRTVEKRFAELGKQAVCISKNSVL